MAEAPESEAGFADEYFVEAAEPVELKLRAARERYLAGASIDLVVGVRNPDLFGEQRIPAPAPGNFALAFRVERLGAGEPEEQATYDDSSRLVRAGVPFDTDAEGYSITLDPEEEREERFDLLGYAGPLEPGIYRVTAVLQAELLEASCELEVIPPAPLCAAREAWEYGRGPDSDGFCLWSSEDPREGIAGTYLTIRAPQDPRLALAARKLSAEVASPGLGVAVSPLYRDPLRHAHWASPAGSSAGVGLRVVRVREGHPEAAWELPTRPLALAGDPQGGLLGLQRGVAGLELVRLSSSSAPRLDAQGLPEPQPATWEPLASFAAPAGALCGLWISCYGPVFVGILGEDGLELVRWVPPADALGQASQSAQRFAWSGAPRWLRLFQGPQDEGGTQAQAYCLIEQAPGQATLLRCVPGAAAVSEDYPAGVEPLAEGALPAGEVHDALLGGGRLQLLLREEQALTLLPFPGIPRVLDPLRYAPAWTQLVQSSPEGGEALYLRGRLEGAPSYEPLEG